MLNNESVGAQAITFLASKSLNQRVLSQPALLQPPVQANFDELGGTSAAPRPRRPLDDGSCRCTKTFISSVRKTQVALCGFRKMLLQLFSPPIWQPSLAESGRRKFYFEALLRGGNRLPDLSSDPLRAVLIWVGKITGMKTAIRTLLPQSHT